MIYLSSEQIESLHYLGKGTFGKVYKIDDHTAYKIYHDKIMTSIKELTYNPALTACKRHFTLLMQRRDKVKESGLIKDLIYVDNKFKGVVIPYYDGEELAEAKLSYKDKIKVSRELVQKLRELHRNLVYPTDIKSNNIILVRDHIELIDLDDVRTHALIYPSPLFSSISRKALAITIYKLMEREHYPVKHEVFKRLSKIKPQQPYTYENIEGYIDAKEKDRTVIFIDRNTDIERLKDNTSTYRESLVYVLDKDEQYHEERIINRLRIYQIPLYDFTIQEQRDRYIDIEPVREAYTYQGNEMRLIYRR